MRSAMVSTPDQPPTGADLRPAADLRAPRFAAALTALAQLLQSFGPILAAQLMTGLGDVFPGLVFRAQLPALVNPPIRDAQGVPMTPAQLVALAAEGLGAQVHAPSRPRTGAGDLGWFDAARDAEVLVCTWPGGVSLGLRSDFGLSPVDLTGPAADAARDRARLVAQPPRPAPGPTTLAEVADATAAEVAAHTSDPVEPADLAELRADLAAGAPVVAALATYVRAGGDTSLVGDVIDRAISSAVDPAAVTELLAADLATPGTLPPIAARSTQAPGVAMAALIGDHLAVVEHLGGSE